MELRDTARRFLSWPYLLLVALALLVIALFFLVAGLQFAHFTRQTAAVTDSIPMHSFRIISPTPRIDSRMETEFFIAHDLYSPTEKSTETHGLFLVSRAEADGSSGYFAGIRVDGSASIEKRASNERLVLAEEPFFQGTYDAETNPNLLPHAEWISLRSDTVTKTAGTEVRLYIRQPNEEEWTLLLSALDESTTPEVRESGYGAVLTDFMDVHLRSLSVNDVPE